MALLDAFFEWEAIKGAELGGVGILLVHFNSYFELGMTIGVELGGIRLLYLLRTLYSGFQGFELVPLNSVFEFEGVWMCQAWWVQALCSDVYEGPRVHIATHFEFYYQEQSFNLFRNPNLLHGPGLGFLLQPSSSSEGLDLVLLLSGVLALRVLGLPKTMHSGFEDSKVVPSTLILS